MKKIFTLLVLSVVALSSISQVSVQWGGSVLAYSSAWPGNGQNPQQVLGPYNVYPTCADAIGAWSPSTPDGQREFIEIGLNEPMQVSQLQIFETNAAGSIDTIYVRQQGTSIWTTVYQNTAAATSCGILTVTFSRTSFNVDAIRIAMNSPVVSGFNEIDAVRVLKDPFNNNAPVYDSLDLPIDHFATLVNPWQYQGCVNPNGESATAMRANNYNFPPSSYDVFSQPFNLAGLNNPILSFYVAHEGYSGAGGGGNEGLEVAVSTDGGSSFTPLLLKFRQDNPSLSTENVTFNFYVPASANAWRHEILDLSAFANQPSFIVRFRSFSTFANNIWIDNFKIVDAATISKTAVTGTPTVASGHMSVAFTSNTRNGDCYIISNTGPAPYFRYKFNPANGATTPDGSTITCATLSPEYFTASFTGQDYLNTLSYDVEIDATSYIATLGSLDQCYIVKRTDEWSPWQPLTTTRTGNILKATGLTRFSQFAVASGVASTLPVTLINFTAIKNGRTVLLQWRTAQEVNNHGFEIQRSADGTNFVSIGWVNAVTNSDIMHDYSFTDLSPLTGKNFYRLKQIDIDGHFKLSPVRKIDLASPVEFIIYPNPANDVINIELSEKAASIKIMDMQGRLIWQKENGASSSLVRVPIDNFSKGMYLIKVSGPDGNSQTQKFIKE